MRIYLIGAFRPSKKSPDAIKIGVAIDVNKRLASIQTGNHLECRIIATWKASGSRAAFAIENHAHYVFRRERLCGEWFKPITARYVDFLNSKAAEDKGHGVKTMERHVDALNSAQIDMRVLAENPWLQSVGGPI